MRGPLIGKIQRARALRENATSAEALLWARLRNRQLNDFKFARQVPVGPYFADFCCREHKLIVEVDGSTHSTEAELASDARRTAHLTAHGYRIIRFTNAQIFENAVGILEMILTLLEGRDHL